MDLDGPIYISPPLDFVSFIRTMLVCGGLMMLTLHVVERASAIRGGRSLLALAVAAGGSYWLKLNGVLNW